MPNVSQISDLSFCSDSEKSITFSGSSIPNTIYNWKNSNSNIGIPSSGIGNIKFLPSSNNNKIEESLITVVPIANGCSGLAKTFSVQIKPIPKLPKVVNPFQSICVGDSSKSIQFIETEGAIIKWNSNNGFAGVRLSGNGNIEPFKTINSSKNSIQVNFSISSELNGCSSPSSILATININPPVISQISTVSNFACVGAPVGPFKVDKSIGGDGSYYNYILQISTDSVEFKTISQNNNFEFIAPPQEKNSWYRVLSESGGCLNYSKTIKILLKENPKLFVNISQNSNIISKGNSIQVFVNGAKNYEWTPSNFVSNPYSSNPYLSPTATTNFSVKGIDNFGCFSEKNLIIEVKENFLIYPNIIITPNGDQINDFWEIKNIEFYPKNSIQIFDTNGQIIKVLNNYSNDWNGSINGLILPIGTYYYQINLNEGASITQGFFSIIY